MTIRPATERDVDTLVAMGCRFMRETAYGVHLTENPAQIASFMRALLAQPETGIVFVSERDDQITGTIVLLKFTHPFSGETTVSELAWWVNPEDRGHGVRLLKRAERWAQSCGATVMQMIAPNENVGRLYQRLGYDRIEEAYQRRMQS